MDTNHGTARNFLGMWGGLGVLSEAYAYISYQDRIMASKAFVTECIEFAIGKRRRNQAACQAINR